jgi:hypothetical protein
MPKKNARQRRRVPPIVAAVVRPVAARLARMEAILIEMRHEEDIRLKRINAIQTQLDTLTEHVRVNGTNIRRLSLPGKRQTRPGSQKSRA